jgi:predicted ester cyclase
VSEAAYEQAQQNKQVALEVWGRDLMERDPDSAEFRAHYDKYYTEDYWNHASEPGKDRGFENAYFVATAFKELFSDAKFEIDMVGADGDLVFLQGTFTALNTGGRLFGIPASGTPVKQDHVHILRFRDGKIAEHFVVRDDFPMYKQITSVEQEGGILRGVDTDQYHVPDQK